MPQAQPTIWDNIPAIGIIAADNVGAEILKDATNNNNDTAIDLAVMAGKPNTLN